MTDHLEKRAADVVAFYDSEGRAALEELGVAELADIDAAASVLRRAVAMRPLTRVGFLGESQVGKSSIINALVGQRVLPSGGLGPLTAQATALTYAKEPSFRVKYHGRKRLNEFRFALERYLQSLGEASLGEVEPTPAPEDGDDSAFGVHLFHPAPDADEPTDANLGDDKRRTGEYLVAQARLMLGLPPEARRQDVLRWVRAIVAKDEKTTLPDEATLRDRIEHIKRLLDATEEVTRAIGRGEFSAALRLRAAGWMSPLVAELEVSLDLPLLEDVELVDLPGVGVVGDPAGRVAERFVREEADALVIVMRNNGLTEQVAELLEETGVISRLLWAAQTDDPKLHVAIAVTRLDDVAKDIYRQRVLDAREQGLPPPKREEVFRELSDPMAQTIKRQIADALQASRELDDLPPDVRAMREAVVRSLCEQMVVLCVAAPDYLGLLEGFDDDCFLRSKDDTNIPRLAEQLVALSSHAKDHRRALVAESHKAFVSSLSSIVTHQEYLRRPRKTAKRDADKRFRELVQLSAEPLKAQAKQNREAFFAVLDTTLPKRLEVVSNQAAEHALKRLVRLKQAGSKMAWSTLNAALVRGGKFRGARNVDYPGSLTRAFVDVIAATWEPSIVNGVRVAYQQLGDADAALIDTLVSRISELVRNDEVEAKLNAARKQIRDSGQVSITWSQAQLEELSEDVRVKLLSIVAPPIERACLQAAKAGHNYGRRARDRILEVFDRSGREAIEKAREATVVVLDEHIKRLRRNLGAVLKDNYDPVSRVRDAIVEAQAEAIAKLSEERRRRELEMLGALHDKLREIEGEASPAKADKALREPALPDARREEAPAPPEAEANVRAVGGSIFDDL